MDCMVWLTTLQRVRVFTMANLHPVVGFHDEEELVNDDQEKERERDMADDCFVQLCIFI